MRSKLLNLVSPQPKDYAVFLLILVLVIIIGGDILAPKYTSIEHFKMLDEVVGATVSGILLIISTYFNDGKDN